MSSQVAVFEAYPGISLSQLVSYMVFSFNSIEAYYVFHIIDANFLKFSSGFYRKPSSEVCSFIFNFFLVFWVLCFLYWVLSFLYVALFFCRLHEGPAPHLLPHPPTLYLPLSK